MHPSAPAGKSCGQIHSSFAITRNNPHEEGSVSTFAATEAGSNSFHLILFSNTVPNHAIPRAV